MPALIETPTGGSEVTGKHATLTEQHPSPIIVFGAPRSGTGYLSAILNQHPDIFITPEARLFIWLDQAINGLTQQNDALLNVRVEFVQHLRDVFPQIVRDFYQKLKPTRYWGDKNPHYAAPAHRGSLQTVATLFPGAHFIHIIRDGRDVVTSLMRKGWGDFEKAHTIWQGHVDAGCEFGRSQPPGAYLELRYEDLIHDDLGVARILFEFLGIPFHECVLRFCNLQRSSRTPISGPTRDLSGGAATSAWATFLTPDQRLRSLGLLCRHLLKYGYETPNSFAARYQKANLDNLHSLVPPLWNAATTLPSEATVLVISKGDDKLLDLPVKRAWHFPQTGEGVYAGYHPADSDEAIGQLERSRDQGFDYLLIPSTAFWWLEHYAGFRDHLNARYRVCHRSDACIIYELRSVESPLSLSPGDSANEKSISNT